MDFNLSEEQRLFQDAVRGFAERHLKDGALARAHEETFPFDVAKLMAEQGLMGITFAEADGGQGGTVMDAVLAIQAVAEFCPRSADVIQAGNFGPIRTFAEYASPAHKEKWLGKLLAGEMAISLGMSEPEAGSAATDLVTSATPDGDGFRVNGTKVFSTHSPEAGIFLIYVRFGPGIDGIGSVILERGQDGFTMGKPVRYVGGEHWCQLYFEDVYVPAENVLLGEGGFRKQIAAFNVERIDFQGIQWKFAEAAAQMEAAQLMLYKVATEATDRLPSAYDTAIAKFLCNESGFRAANDAMQVLGALGYTEESLVEYCWRRTRGWQIAGGSLEMMKNRIAEGVFGKRFSQRAPRAK